MKYKLALTDKQIKALALSLMEYILIITEDENLMNDKRSTISKRAAYLDKLYDSIINQKNKQDTKNEKR